MPLFLINEQLAFPDPDQATEEGLLAVGGDLSPKRLLLAYSMGIFPWFSPPDPILWWSPDPRCVLLTNEVRISKSMRNVINQQKYRVTFDTAFLEVMAGCQNVQRPGQQGTWITSEVINSYFKLHEMGYAHSVEVWEETTLVGGLYGVSLGNMFFGESMFTRKSNTSKLALIQLCHSLKKEGFEIIDCQIYNDHLGRMGATHIPRTAFLSRLSEGLNRSTLQGYWHHFNQGI